MFWGKGKTEGQIHSGTWKNGKLDAGRAKFIYSDGAKYEGNQKGGKREGDGTLTEANGTVYKGKWKGDKKNDPNARESTKDDATIYEGGFKNDLKEGVGKTTVKGQKPKFNEWKKGKDTKEIDEQTYNKKKK